MFWAICHCREIINCPKAHEIEMAGIDMSEIFQW
jgi:hypothetical protein